MTYLQNKFLDALKNVKELITSDLESELKWSRRRIGAVGRSLKIKKIIDISKCGLFKNQSLYKLK